MSDISGFGNNYPSELVAGPNLFTLVLAKPAHVMVNWGANPNTPQGPGQGVNIAATIAGLGYFFTGSGNQTNGSIVSSTKATDKIPAGTYTLTMTPTSSDSAKQGQLAPTNVTISNKCSYPR